MATQFTRLYRELCNSDPNGPVNDIHFNKERKGVLASLGHAVNIHKDVSVQLCKHHGKGARRRGPAARLKAIGIEDSLKIKREREVRMLSMKTSKVHELTSKIQGLLQEDKFVSKNLWAQYDQIYGESQEEVPATQKKSNNRGGKYSVKQIPKAIPEKKGVQKRTKSSIRIDYSKNKWTKPERDKLTTIYWELKRPSTKTRSIDSIIEKVRYMFDNRLFAEPGESTYWKSVTDSHTSLKCTAPGKESKSR